MAGQRIMQAATNIFLGWFRSSQRHDYYVRQFRDMKVSAEVETFLPRTLIAMCGWAVARAHAKTGEPAIIAGYLGSNDSRYGDHSSNDELIPARERQRLLWCRCLRGRSCCGAGLCRRC
jgi:hypothetical protein